MVLCCDIRLLPIASLPQPKIQPPSMSRHHGDGPANVHLRSGVVAPSCRLVSW